MTKVLIAFNDGEVLERVGNARIDGMFYTILTRDKDYRYPIASIKFIEESTVEMEAYS